VTGAIERRLDDPPLLEALRSSQRLGMLGPGPVEDVVDHGAAFLEALATTRGTVVDLGTGGGVPGLVIGWMRPDLRLLLVDRRARRTDHLRRLVARLGLGERVEVITADIAALGPAWSGRVDAVVARGFGPPISTLRSALPLTVPRGIVVVSEPPEESLDRWPDAVLAELGVERRTSDRRVAVFARRATA
jgi:16S rRNA (guanine527-N7)-methyltransferase